MPRRDRARRARSSTRAAVAQRDGPQHLGVAVLAAKIALVPIVFDPGALAAFALPKATLSALLAVALVAIIVTLTLRHRRTFWIRTPVTVAVVAFFLAYVVATAFALDRYLAVFGSHDRLLGLLSVADGAILCIALVQLPRTAADVRLLIGAGLAGGAIVLTYGLLQSLGLDPIKWSENERNFGTLGNATVYGHLLAVLAAAALAVAASTAATGPERTGLAALSALFLIAAVFSGTRAVLLGVPVLLLLAVVAIRRLPMSTEIGALLPRRAIAIGVLVLAIAGVGAASVLAVGGRVASVITDPGRLASDPSIGGRLVIYEVAIRALQDHVLTGVGPSNFEIVFPTYRPERDFAMTGIAVPETSAHSWLASLATDAGMLGLIAFAALLATLVRVSWKHASNDLVILGWAVIVTYLAVGLVTVNDVGTQWLFWAGVAAVARGAAVSPQAESVGRQRAPDSVTRYLVPAAAAAIWLLASLPALGASHSAAASNAGALTGHYDAAITAGRDAVASDGRRAIYWQYLGIAYTRVGRFRDAGDAFAQAVDLAPHNAVYRANYARAQIGLGTGGDKTALGAALEAARTAVSLDPNNPDAQFALALAAAANGLYEDAVRASERGRVLDPAPKDVGVYEVASRSYLRLSRPADAERWARDGLSITGVSGKTAIPIRLTLAQVLVALGRNSEALQQLSLVTAVDPTNAEVARILALINATRP